MVRTRRSTRSSYARSAPYNLRSRSRVRYNFFDSISENDKVIGETAEKQEPLPVVTALDLLLSENSKAHRTDQYEVDYLVLRRGQHFSFRLKLNRPLKTEEKVSLIITTGHTPYPSKGTLLSFPIRESYERFGWAVEATTGDEQEFELKILSSPEAIIGRYNITVQVSSDEATKTSKLKETFCLIFNPWNSEDDVYLKGEAEKEEYVMNETGRIWVGSKDRNYGKPWVFGQFEACSLEAALYVLEISDLSDIALSNPVIVSRTFSKMTNSFDDNGILVGNWSGDYSGGNEPTDWISSTEILKQYVETHEGVKYGQCWVFSGLITTLCRAVGIPARSITNFESAHDNDGSMTIDRHWNWDDKPLEDLNDSIWNFHVWNELWFRRADLPDGHDGWQVIDGTPQENSEGVMQCGPSSIKAIKEGEVYLPYDAKFVIAEVNGDIIEWVKEKNGEMKPVLKQPHSVGFNISTKSVGSSLREDVTDHYKHKEGTAMERKVVSHLVKFSSRKDELLKFYNVSSSKSVEFNLRGVGYNTGDVDINLDIKSSHSGSVTIDVTLTCVASYYNGVTSDELKAETQQIKLDSKDSTSVNMKLAGGDYLNKIATDATVAVFCKARVHETGQRFFKKETFSVDRPDIVVDAPSSVDLNEEFSVDISFTNHLRLPLTECRLILDGPGIQAVRPIKLTKSSIAAGETIKQTMTFRARSRGVKEMVALLHTRQLQNVTGSTTVRVI